MANNELKTDTELIMKKLIILSSSKNLYKSIGNIGAIKVTDINGTKISRA